MITETLLHAENSLEVFFAQEHANREHHRKLTAVPETFHASQSGGCKRKTLFDWYVGGVSNVLDSSPAGNLLTELTMMKQNAESDPTWIGLMEAGWEMHRRIQDIMMYKNMLIYGDVVSDPSDVNRYLKTVTSFGEEFGFFLDIHGTIDMVIEPPPSIRATKQQFAQITEIKSCGDARARVFRDQCEEQEGLRIVQARPGDAMQAATYHMGVSEALKSEYDIAPDPVVLYVSKVNYERFWAPVDMEEWGPRATDYWILMYDVYREFVEKFELPPAVPEEKWECRWGKKGPVFCRYHGYCFRKEENDREEGSDSGERTDG